MLLKLYRTFMFNHSQIKSFGLGLLACSVYVLSPAAVADSPDISVSGFASFAYSKAINEDAQDVAIDSSGNTEKWAGLNNLTEDGEYRDFNKFGLRLNADLDHNLSLGAQLIANGEDDYDPNFDWLYVQYNFTPNVSLKLGRTTAPLFMYSDFLDTTYAYQWIEAPYAVYGSGTIKTNEGFMLDWKTEIGSGWSSLLTVFGGQVDEFVPELQDNVTINNGIGLAWDVEFDWLRLRAVHYIGKSTVAGIGSQLENSINAGLLKVSGNLSEPAISQNLFNSSFDSYNDMAWEDSDAAYTGLGVGLDFEYIFFNAEATRVDIENTATLGLLDSWYTMIGARLPGDVSIAFTYSENDDEKSKYDFNQLTAELINYYNSVSPTLGDSISPFIKNISDSVLQTLQASRYEKTTTYTLSGRWDFHPSASLKLEYLVQDRNQVDFNLEDVNRKPSAYRAGIDLVF